MHAFSYFLICLHDTIIQSENYNVTLLALTHLEEICATVVVQG